MVRPEGVEPPTYWFVASCSIQLSYGRTLQGCNSARIPEMREEGNLRDRRSEPPGVLQLCRTPGSDEMHVLL